MSAALHFRALKILLSCLVFLAMSQILSAASLRGRLDRTLPNGARVPVGGITVTVFSQATGRSSPAVSQQDGMYYLNNVPAGDYNLEVWIRGTNNPPLAYGIRVIEPYTDVAPIILP